MDELTCKRAYITRVSTDKDKYHTMQASYHGQTADVEMITPYGVYATLPLDSQVILWNVNGVEENRVAIGNTPPVRFKNLKPGEVVVGSPQTLSNAFFKTDGSIIITGKNNAVITFDAQGNITVAGGDKLTLTSVHDMQFTSGGNMTFNATGNFVVTAADITLNGEHEPDV